MLHTTRTNGACDPYYKTEEQPELFNLNLRVSQTRMHIRHLDFRNSTKNLPSQSLSLKVVRLGIAAEPYIARRGIPATLRVVV